MDDRSESIVPLVKASMLSSDARAGMALAATASGKGVSVKIYNHDAGYFGERNKKLLPTIFPSILL